jgi:CHAT domain-containing protein
MPGRKTTRRKLTTVPHASRLNRARRADSSQKVWTFLIYMCGDNDLEPFINEDFAEICRVGSQPDIHIVVQRDRREGARRYLLPEGPAPGEPPPDPALDNVRVNTGEPAEAVTFFQWGIEQAPSKHVAVIFSGLGISPSYVRQHLPQAEGPASGPDIDTRVQQQLFSICHDQTSRDALEAHELCAILEKVQDKLHRPIDLVGLDMGATAFVEIAYEMNGPVQVLVASQRLLPDDGWPYEKIIKGWQQQIATRHASAGALGRLIVDAVTDAYPKHDVRMTAVNLTALEKTSRVLDTLSLALMQSLGDWHVLNAFRQAVQNTRRISLEIPAHKPAANKTPSPPAQPEFLPAVDMLEVLQSMHVALAEEVNEAPREFGQRDRIAQLRDLVKKALDVLKSGKNSEPSLLLHARPAGDHGLSILLPPWCAPEHVKAEVGPTFDLAQSNYLSLKFSQRTHWAALLGAFQLIMEKPHALWRLISSMLADAGGPVRDALLRRLISPDSVIEGLKRQFQSLSVDSALTLSLDPKDLAVHDHEPAVYRLRLESTVAGATIAQQESRVYQPTIDAALQGLEQLLNSAEQDPHVERQLQALGRTLGEDVIQDLADRLEDERTEACGEHPDGTPHLRLHIPRELMRYPWELMFDRHGVLCERFALGRQVFMEMPLTRPVLRRQPGPIQVLIIGDPQFDQAFLDHYQRQYKWLPRQLPGTQHEARTVAHEFQRLDDELAGLPAIEITRLIGTRISTSDFRQRLRSGQFDLIHYAGHAYFDKKDPESSAWLLSDGFLRAREIRNTLAWTESPPWLVFANACEAGMDAEAPTSHYQGDVFGLATAFINQAVTAYVAPLWPVDDAVAMQLAVDFYRALLLDRATLGEALRRAKVRAKQDLNNRLLPSRVTLSWASVVLYGDPTPRLLQSLWTPYTERDDQLKEKGKPVMPAPRRVKARASGAATGTDIDQ